jgi:sorbitol-specific phosphotransferase system component IIC
MQKILLLFLLIAVPMAVVQLLYRIIDRKGKLTGKLTARFPFLKEHKFAVQIGGAMGFIVVFGLIAWAAKISLAVYFIVCGAVLGFINGMATTIMYTDD